MQNKQLKWTFYVVVLLLLLAGSILFALTVGEIRFSLNELVDIFSRKEGIEYTILSRIRLPRIMLGVAVGGALSLAGVLLQGIYRNPLVEPYTLGISGGASLMVAISIVFGVNMSLGGYVLPAAGFLGSVITIFIVYFLSMGRYSININKMLLIGVMVSFVASSAMMFLMSTTTNENLQSIVFWVMGSLAETDVVLINTVFYVAMAGLTVSYLFANSLNAMRLGVSGAGHLGINTGLTIRILFIVASLMTGVSVAVAGVIGFVGLVIPHLTRMVVGSDFRILLITSFLGGGIFVVLCDVLARLIIAPNELPIGVITGMIGGLVFIGVLARK
ncbi:MAG: iron ABC transporter permease [Chlorobi bacterium]|nr:iron ABC transporter permease [Chlorobiota bacterium]